jgi:signal transduction histidine kinase
VEAGSGVRKLAVVNLSELCEHVFRMYLPVAEDYQHRLLARIEAGISVRGDSELLTQMFVNLIENAIRHTPAQSTIELALRLEATAITASVTDNGPGIPADQTQKVLKRFYRLGGSRSEAGHGLGLALVAAVVQLHQASLSLHNAGPGLSVQIRFPGLT